MDSATDIVIFLRGFAAVSALATTDIVIFLRGFAALSALAPGRHRNMTPRHCSSRLCDERIWFIHTQLLTSDLTEITCTIFDQ